MRLKHTIYLSIINIRNWSPRPDKSFSFAMRNTYLHVFSCEHANCRRAQTFCCTIHRNVVYHLKLDQFPYENKPVIYAYFYYHPNRAVFGGWLATIAHNGPKNCVKRPVGFFLSVQKCLCAPQFADRFPLITTNGRSRLKGRSLRPIDQSIVSVRK